MQESQEMHVQSLAWEDSLEEEVATSFSILVWKTLWTEQPGGLQSMSRKDVSMTEQLTLSFSLQEMKKTLRLETDSRSVGVNKICLQPVRPNLYDF